MRLRLLVSRSADPAAHGCMSRRAARSSEGKRNAPVGSPGNRSNHPNPAYEPVKKTRRLIAEHAEIAEKTRCVSLRSRRPLRLDRISSHALISGAAMLGRAFVSSAAMLAGASAGGMVGAAAIGQDRG